MAKIVTTQDKLLSTTQSLSQNKQDKSINIENITAKTVEGALAEIHKTTSSIGAGLTTVNNEISSIKSKNTTQDTEIKKAADTAAEAKTKADNAYNLANGRNRAFTYETKAAMTAAVKASAKDTFKVGDNIYIKEANVPDYWVSAVLSTNTGTYGYFELTELEGKIDLSAYQTKSDNSLATTAKTIVGAINEVKSNRDSTNDSLAAHIKDKSNPHGVNKSQVGLGSVVNTGDSATPVQGGTTKFTTGGAYTELAKKQDKNVNVGTLGNTTVEAALKSILTTATTANSTADTAKSTADNCNTRLTTAENTLSNVKNKQDIMVGGGSEISVSSALTESFTFTSTQLQTIHNINNEPHFNVTFLQEKGSTVATNIYLKILFTRKGFYGIASGRHYLYDGYYSTGSNIYKVYLDLLSNGSTFTQHAIRIETYASIS